MNTHARLAASLAVLTATGFLGGTVALGLLAPSSAGEPSTGAAAAAGTTGITAEQALAENAEAVPGETAYDAASATTVTLAGTTATASGSGVDVAGATVTITAPGTYVLSGVLAGQVVVDSSADGTVQLVLSDATIRSTTGAAIAVTQASRAVVVLADATTNTLASAATFADTTSEDAPNAALFSMADLTVGGDGALVVEAPSLDGIASKDALVLSGGTLTVDAADDGVRGLGSRGDGGGEPHADRGGESRRG